MRYGIHNVTPVHGTMLENLSFFVTLQNGQESQGQNNSSCAQLHHPS